MQRREQLQEALPGVGASEVDERGVFSARDGWDEKAFRLPWTAARVFFCGFFRLLRFFGKQVIQQILLALPCRNLCLPRTDNVFA